MDCPRVHERSVSADLKRAGSGDEIDCVLSTAVGLLYDPKAMVNSYYTRKLSNHDVIGIGNEDRETQQ